MAISTTHDEYDWFEVRLQLHKVCQSSQPVYSEFLHNQFMEMHFMTICFHIFTVTIEHTFNKVDWHYKTGPSCASCESGTIKSVIWDWLLRSVCFPKVAGDDQNNVCQLQNLLLTMWIRTLKTVLRTTDVTVAMGYKSLIWICISCMTKSASPHLLFWLFTKSILGSLQLGSSRDGLLPDMSI